MSMARLVTAEFAGGVRSGVSASAVGSSPFRRRAVRALRACIAVAVVSVAGMGVAVSSAQAELFSFGEFFRAFPDGTAVHQQRIAVDHATGYVLVTNVVGDQIDVYAPSVGGGGA